MAIETNTSAYSRLRCPATLPNPELPPTTVVVDKNSLDIYSPDFVFTERYIKNHSEQHWSYQRVSYSMNISVTNDASTYMLMAMLGFDFTLTDFSLGLYKSDGTSVGIVSGSPPFFVSHLLFW